MDGMANICELSINVVTSKRLKVLMGRSQRGTAAGAEGSLSSAMGTVLYGHAAGGKGEPKPILSFMWNVVSPYRSQ